MRGRPIAVFVVVILFLTGFQSINAGDENQPEIDDERNDAYRSWDILSSWFHEPTMEKSLLCITLKMHELTRIGPSTYTIRFSCDETVYEANASISLLGIPRFTLHVIDEEVTQYAIKGNLDFQSDCVTFKIPKDEYSDLRRGKHLTHTFAMARYDYSEWFNQYSIMYNMLCDTAHGENYIIKY
jgi:hypothetical protein